MSALITLQSSSLTKTSSSNCLGSVVTDFLGTDRADALHELLCSITVDMIEYDDEELTVETCSILAIREVTSSSVTRELSARADEPVMYTKEQTRFSVDVVFTAIEFDDGIPVTFKYTIDISKSRDGTRYIAVTD